MNIHLPLALSLLLAAPQPALGDKLDALLKHEMRLRRIPGVAFAVVDHGRVVAKRTYGFANLETGTRVRSDSVFEVASVTKPFTATAVIALAEEGKLNLDDPISKFIDGTPATWKSITVRHLLSHTSGLPGGSPVKRDGSPLLEITTRQQYDDVLMCSLASVPGERGLYSDPGYFLLGMIIEKVSGLPYNQYMEKRIFGPAGMKSSRIGDRRAIVRNHASCYLLRDGQLENDRRVWQHELPSFFGMWTTLGYPSDLTDSQWEEIEPLIPPAKPGGRPRKTNMRAVLNAINYVVRTGCQWRFLPRDFPPKSTVYDYFWQWGRDDTWATMHDTL